MDFDINDYKQALKQAEHARDYWLSVIEKHNAVCPPEWAIDLNPAPQPPLDGSAQTYAPATAVDAGP